MASCDCDTHLDCEGHVRRDVLKVGVLGAFGFGLSNLFALRSAQAAAAKQEVEAAQREHRAPRKAADGDAQCEQVILVWTGGGMSHIDTFDPKPGAPEEYRGPFAAIPTKTPGLRFSEHMKQLAAISGDLCIVHSMTTNEGAHERGTHYMMTGFPPLPGFGVPSFGSVVSKMMGKRGALPPYVALPNSIEYGGAGFLGAALDPFSPGGDPSQAGFKVRNFEPEGGLTVDRIDRRRDLRASVDMAFSRFEAASDSVKAVDDFYQSAYAVISSQAARAAFDLRQEKDALRDSYGRNGFGQSLLLARRLVETGVRFVTVSNGGWDNHNQIGKSLAGKLPSFDQGLAALVTDLKQRGMLEKTLVMVMGEFGRTPKVNDNSGRDHYPTAFSMMLAGGGTKGGTVVGQTDEKGALVAERPVGPPDVSATLYTLLGIDYNTELHSPEGIRILLSRGGAPIGEALV